MRVAVALALLAALAVASGAMAGLGEVLPISISESIDPGNVTILVGKYGKGLSIGPCDTRRGVRDYLVDVSWGRRVKILAYCPGYKMVTFDSADVLFAEPFIPRFEPLKMLPVTLRLVDSKGTPLAWENVRITHSLREMEFFGYADGMVFPVTVAAGITNFAGELPIEVPCLLYDPYFTSGERPLGGFGIKVLRSISGGFDLVPRVIPLQTSYPGTLPGTLVVTLVRRAKLIGQVERSFWKKHGIQPRVELARKRDKRYFGNVSVFAKRKGARGSQGWGVKADGSFSFTLPPGTYQISVSVYAGEKGFTKKSIPVFSDLVLQEEEQRHISLR